MRACIACVVLLIGIQAIAWSSDIAPPALTRTQPDFRVISPRAGVVALSIKAGDMVAKGQLLAKFDDGAADNAIDALVIGMASVSAKQADYQATVKTADEAWERIHARIRSRDTAAEIQGARVTWQRYVAEAAAKKAGVQAAERNVELAKARVAEFHEIRSPCRGVVIVRCQRDGKVRQGEVVFEIAVQD